MVQKANAKLTFMGVWTFPYEVEQRIAEFVKNHPGIWLHAPVGISKIALGPFNDKVHMETLDINADLKPDHVCDIFKVKEYFKGRRFDGIISDPIWYTEEKHKTKGLSYPDRRYFSYNIRDILKPGGWWLFNGLWNPTVKGLHMTNPNTNQAGTPMECPVQKFSSFRNLSLLIYLQKNNGILN